ncbi:MAG: DASH family cryptochrome [Nonlabens sp.]
MPSKEKNAVPAILWFKNDLRIHDNEALTEAYKSGYHVLPIYIIDSRLFEKDVLHFKKASTIRYTFLMQTLADLRLSLQERGTNLLILEGIPEEILPELVSKYGVRSIYCEQEYTQEEIDVVKAVCTAVSPACDVYEYWGKTLYHLQDIPYSVDKIPLTSKAFRINTGKKAQVRPLFEAPQKWQHYIIDNYGLSTSKYLKDQGNADSYLRGGELNALKRLDYYTQETELLTSYKWTRNKSLGMDYSSKLSPFMALGAISPRLIYYRVKEYEVKVKKNISTWWLVFEVVWRDYFTFKAMRMGNAIFKTEGYSKKQLEFNNNPDLFIAWCNGKTGIPFIDSHMRQLNQTGYMSNRGRVNCASFLVHDLKIDWTWGAAYFESLLIDYDVSSNWMNWHSQAYEIWYTNPINQSLKYKAYDYIHKWIPELRDIKDEMIYIPWELGRKLDYPDAVVKFDKWNRAIKKIQEAAGQQELF